MSNRFSAFCAVSLLVQIHTKWQRNNEITKQFLDFIILDWVDFHEARKIKLIYYTKRLIRIIKSSQNWAPLNFDAFWKNLYSQIDLRANRVFCFSSSINKSKGNLSKRGKQSQSCTVNGSELQVKSSLWCGVRWKNLTQEP